MAEDGEGGEDGGEVEGGGVGDLVAGGAGDGDELCGCVVVSASGRVIGMLDLGPKRRGVCTVIHVKARRFIAAPPST